jgi:hypothetical protein
MNQLHRDIATAQHHRAFRALEVEEIVRGDAQLAAGSGAGMAASRHQDVAAVKLAVDIDGMRIFHRRKAAMQAHVGTIEQALVDAVQVRDLAVLVGDQGGPVEGGCAVQGPAVTGGVGEILVEMGL